MLAAQAVRRRVEAGLRVRRGEGRRTAEEHVEDVDAVRQGDLAVVVRVRSVETLQVEGAEEEVREDGDAVGYVDSVRDVGVSTDEVAIEVERPIGRLLLAAELLLEGLTALEEGPSASLALVGVSARLETGPDDAARTLSAVQAAVIVRRIATLAATCEELLGTFGTGAFVATHLDALREDGAPCSCAALLASRGLRRIVATGVATLEELADVSTATRDQGRPALLLISALCDALPNETRQEGETTLLDLPRPLVAAVDAGLRPGAVLGQASGEDLTRLGDALAGGSIISGSELGLDTGLLEALGQELASDAPAAVLTGRARSVFATLETALVERAGVRLTLLDVPAHLDARCEARTGSAGAALLASRRLIGLASLDAALDGGTRPGVALIRLAPGFDAGLANAATQSDTALFAVRRIGQVTVTATATVETATQGRALVRIPAGFDAALDNLPGSHGAALSAIRRRLVAALLETALEPAQGPRLALVGIVAVGDALAVAHAGRPLATIFATRHRRLATVIETVFEQALAPSSALIRILVVLDALADHGGHAVATGLLASRVVRSAVLAHTLHEEPVGSSATLIGLVVIGHALFKELFRSGTAALLAGRIGLGLASCDALAQELDMARTADIGIFASLETLAEHLDTVYATLLETVERRRAIASLEAAIEQLAGARGALLGVVAGLDAALVPCTHPAGAHLFAGWFVVAELGDARAERVIEDRLATLRRTAHLATLRLRAPRHLTAAVLATRRIGLAVLGETSAQDLSRHARAFLGVVVGLETPLEGLLRDTATALLASRRVRLAVLGDASLEGLGGLRTAPLRITSGLDAAASPRFGDGRAALLASRWLDRVTLAQTLFEESAAAPSASFPVAPRLHTFPQDRLGALPTGLRTARVPFAVSSREALGQEGRQGEAGQTHQVNRRLPTQIPGSCHTLAPFR